MDAKVLQSVCRQVYQKHPEVRGATPKVKPQTRSTFLLIFEGKGTTANGQTIRHTIRAIVTADGKITKLTSSR
ncbi:hypothetical protein BECAL_02437 [Bellilinea caldifistulae]|uniref:Uncharacterized protein n=1 Tax=Bellilinea caldifistulae TaxID=360411 RepID=A0A0P6WUL1_9CHLR|nr:hypothetical protein [Bellilinea caldifistulae]KPL73947.1 hypothetical protein AC812_14360 [Bellilinea caldifistulae]GAP11251.1 hypothetical protein BECAL_02437 [Bellilinea caldifistulae]